MISYHKIQNAKNILGRNLTKPEKNFILIQRIL